MNNKVTVLMPVYNGGKYLAKSIQSIFDQTYKNFELLIINDGSSDNGEKIIKNFKDYRIRYLKNASNLGLIKTLNIGIDESNSEYIARMDQDDISLPRRLEKQIKFMDDNPEIGVAGSWAKMFGDINYVNKHYAEHEELKAHLLFNTCFVHPAVIFRSNILKNKNLRYNEEDEGAEDYGFWVSLVDKTKFANISEILLNYRMHQANMSKIFTKDQISSADKHRKKILSKINIIPDDNDFKIHKSLKFNTENQIDNINKAELWLLKIIEMNSKNKYFQEEKLLKIIKRRWLNICYNNTNLKLWIWKKFWKSNLSRGAIKVEPKFLAKLFYKCFT